MEACYCDVRWVQSSALQTLLAFGSKQEKVTLKTNSCYWLDVTSGKGVSLFRESSTSIASCAYSKSWFGRYSCEVV